MRLDKFLKIARLVKRRTLAKALCDKGRVSIDGRVAKAGSEVSIGNKLSICLGQKILEVEVTDLCAHGNKLEAKKLYKLLAE